MNGKELLEKYKDCVLNGKPLAGFNNKELALANCLYGLEMYFHSEYGEDKDISLENLDHITLGKYTTTNDKLEWFVNTDSKELILEIDGDEHINHDFESLQDLAMWVCECEKHELRDDAFSYYDNIFLRFGDE